MPRRIFEFKMVIAVRTDLNMSKGKMAVQVAHAAVTAAEEAKRRKLKWFKKWYAEGQKKIVVKVSDEKELHQIYQKAKRNNLPCSFINDAGLTELPTGAATAVGIGPAPNQKVDKVTSHLKLL